MIATFYFYTFVIMSDTMRRVAQHTLGCKLNFSESSDMCRRLESVGFERVDFDSQADVYIINTCSVTEEANKKCRSIIKRCIRRNADAFIIVTGCYAQLRPDEVAKIEHVDLILGSNEKSDLLDYVGDFSKRTTPIVVVGDIVKDKRFAGAYSVGDRTRSFLKIQDGCDYFCTYCTIPFARGVSRSDTVENTVKQAQEAASRGAKEIILTGVNIGDFGRRNGESFLQLVEALEAVEGIERYRISSIEPNLLTDEIIRHVAASHKFMPHFHVPLQSGSDAVLKFMHRRYTADFFRRKIADIKSVIPHAFIGIDVIVGTNGETEELFDETYRLLSQIDFSQLHVFTYSERPGTQALKITPVVPLKERQRRNAVLHELSEERHAAFVAKHVGTVANVLFESDVKDGLMSGFTENYIKVEVPYCPQFVNTIQRVKIGASTSEIIQP
jgi:threonylcarbamoyladenosine tRNA methylthiotransferase MtaB